MFFLLKDIRNNKLIFFILFLGFFFSIFSISICISTKNYFEEKSFESVNGKFNYYYNLNLKFQDNLDLSKLQELTKKSFKTSSVISEKYTPIDNFNNSSIVLLLNYNWQPPLVKGRNIKENENKSVILGDSIVSSLGKITIGENSYTIAGIAGDGSDSDYSHKIFMPASSVNSEIKQKFLSSKVLYLTVRSNSEPKSEIDNFLLNLKNMDKTLEFQLSKIDNSNLPHYRISEIIEFPLKLFIISTVNQIIISYLWIYKRKKDFSLMKALGAGNLSIMVFVFWETFICSLAAFIATSLLQTILNSIGLTAYNIILNASYSSFFVSFLITLVITTITLLIPVIKIFKLSAAKALKE